MRLRVWTAAAIGALVAAGVGLAAPAATPAERDAHENLHAVLWVQTSAEYQAITRGLYHVAALQLDRGLADPRWTAAPEQAGRPDLPRLEPAVILDVDETVLSNAPEEGQRVLDRAGFDSAQFDAWVRRAEAVPLGGAKEFIDYAGTRGVDVFYITNRSVEQKAATVENLSKRGIPATPQTVLCRGEYGPDGDKTGRRQHVAAAHRLLLMIGDDLGDFVAVADPGGDRFFTPAERAVLVDRTSGYWEDRWIVLPNPLYGSWERALYPSGLSDADSLEKQRAAVTGM